MNATSTPTTIAVCVDCLMWLANGDTPNEDQGGCVDHWEPPQGEITLGLRLSARWLQEPRNHMDGRLLTRID